MAHILVLLELVLSLDCFKQGLGLNTVEYPFILEEIFEKGLVRLQLIPTYLWRKYLGMEF